MQIDTLHASLLLGNKLVGKGVIRTGIGVHRAGQNF